MWVDPKGGQSTGRIKHPDSLLRAVQSLVNRSRVNAIAVVGRFPDEDIGETDDYRQGLVCKILHIMTMKACDDIYIAETSTTKFVVKAL